MRERRGFTLIELVVAMALLIVFIGMVLGTLSNYLGARSANEQEIILQQNFRNATDRMRYDLMQAGSNDPIKSPESNRVSHDLSFKAAEGESTTITYSVVNDGGGTCYIARTESGQPTQPVTEEMHQLVDLYFVRSGGKITVIVVGRMTFFGSTRTISFASMMVSRNANYQGF